MSLSKKQLWRRFQQHYSEYPDLGLALDLSRMRFPDEFFPLMEPRIQQAFVEMAALERGAIANPDENRRVGHYWLRNPSLAPSPDLTHAIEQTVADIKSFAAEVHAGRIHGATGPFKYILLIGIGGSALGPQFVAHALGHPHKDKLTPFFSDNTDPDGFDRLLAQLDGRLGQTLCIVVSKSGGTKETRNGMVEAEAAFKKAGLNFSQHAVAITRESSALDDFARQNGWLRRFPMWDWVGGRTSELSAVGLLPAALQGIDINGLLDGARACDIVTRQPNTRSNPAALMALMWYYSGNGKGDKNLIILPYKDRLELFSRYLQQLIMESLGKELDRDKKVVNQGLTVFGNKGATDQHSYIQQLREGLSNFFVTFIEVLKDRDGHSIEVEPSVTSGDYLSGFMLGTREALFDKNRESITLTLREVSPFSVGVLIALFERAVGLYASLINVNAYHQPGVEAGKKAASTVIEIQRKILSFLSTHPTAFTADQLAEAIGQPDDGETVFKICEHLSANPSRSLIKKSGSGPANHTYCMTKPGP